MIEYSGDIVCEHCDFKNDGLPDERTWGDVKTHIIVNPGHQVTFMLTVGVR